MITMKIKIIFTFLFAFLLLLQACSGDEKTFGIKEKVRHNNFIYSVEEVMKTPEFVGTKANGTFYVIMFKVINEDKSLSHEWNNNSAYIEDENGREYGNVTELKKEFCRINYEKYTDNYVTAAGKTDSTVLVFELPAEVKQPFLKFRADFRIGDLFEGNSLANSRIKLN